jgi:hypothetical protein
MMKYLLLIAFACFIAPELWSQIEVASPDQLKSFFKTTTCVVKDIAPMSEYNASVKEIMDKNWTVTPVTYISEEEFEKKRKDPAFSFITLDVVYFESDKTGAKYDFLCLSLGGNYKTTSDMPQLCTIPLCYDGVDEEYYVYKMTAFIKFMQQHVKLTSEHPELKKSNLLDYYQKNAGSLKDKILYLVNDELDPKVNSEAEIQRLYPYKYKLVSRDDIQTVIDNGEQNAIFLHKVGPAKDEGITKNARCYKIILGAADAKLYYFDYHMISDKNPDALLESDFKKLGK